MNVRMIFGTSVDGADWRAGRCYDATPAQAARLVASGRAEPSAPVAAEPVAAEPASEPAPRRTRKR